MHRYINNPIKNALDSKIVLLSGPRQSGKTTLAKELYPDFDYFNYDVAEDRIALQEKNWDRKKTLVVFDELHKMKEWKRWVKGVYDKEGVSRPHLLVTGSAKLNMYRKVGDSLAGRYFSYRLYPLDLKEIQHYAKMNLSPEEAFERLWHCGGFPEPFTQGSETFYRLWRRTHLDIILRQDLLDLQAVRDIQAIETLVALLKTRVGSPISYASLARDLERDANTVKRWLQLLENLYVIFRITPYHKNIARALLKEPKYYFFDTAQVENAAARLENIVALSLLKELHFIEDTVGYDTSLHFIRNKEGKEIDFFIMIDKKPTHLIEVKWADNELSPAFHSFLPVFNNITAVQLVKNCTREKTYPEGMEIRSLIPWLTRLDLMAPGFRAPPPTTPPAVTPPA